jgi:hypothetical protein
LTELVDERNKKMTAEALGMHALKSSWFLYISQYFYATLSLSHVVSADKLKSLGNSLLGNFGLSLDNFKMQQDPATGSWSIRWAHVI